MSKLYVALCVSGWVSSTAESFRRRGRRRTKILPRNPGACAQAAAVELQHSALPQTRSRQTRPSGKSPPATRSVRSLPSPDRYVNPCPRRSPAAAICALGRHLRNEPSAGNSRQASIVRGRAVKVGDGNETCRSLLRVGGQPTPDPLLSFDPEISTPASRRSCVTVRAEPRAGAGEASHGLCPLDYSLAPRRSRKPPWRTYGPSFGSCKAALGRRAVARVWQCPNGTQANQEACLSPRPKGRRSCPGWLAMCVALHAVPEPRSHTCSSVPLRTRSPGPPQRRRRRRSAALV